MSRDYQGGLKTKQTKTKHQTERLRSLKKSILMPLFKGGRHIYEAFLYEKGVLILIVLAETPQNKRRKVADNLTSRFILFI